MRGNGRTKPNLAHLDALIQENFWLLKQLNDLAQKEAALERSFMKLVRGHEKRADRYKKFAQDVLQRVVSGKGFDDIPAIARRRKGG